jgi:uncharacterized protein (DUF849 family)
MITLPQIMVAPNGARRGKSDHPGLPITHDEIVATAVACWAAGAGAIHVHVRDAAGNHVLDAERYRRVTAAIHEQAPGMIVQVTTEAMGRYSPAQQIALVRQVRPEAVSIALREICPPGTDPTAALALFEWCRGEAIAVQHILYSPDDVLRLGELLDLSASSDRPGVLFVLGQYVDAIDARPQDIEDWLKVSGQVLMRPDWMVCAFGTQELACLEEALGLGGKIRVGFENNIAEPDGRLVQSNASQVARVKAMADQIGGRPLAAGGSL